MVHTAVTEEALSLDRKQYVSAFRWMLLARLLEDKLSTLYRAAKIHGGVYRGKGQEALSASIGVSLRKGDTFAPLIRDQAGRLAFGEQPIGAKRMAPAAAVDLPTRGSRQIEIWRA